MSTEIEAVIDVARRLLRTASKDSYNIGKAF